MTIGRVGWSVHSTRRLAALVSPSSRSFWLALLTALSRRRSSPSATNLTLSARPVAASGHALVPAFGAWPLRSGSPMRRRPGAWRCIRS